MNVFDNFRGKNSVINFEIQNNSYENPPEKGTRIV